MKIWKNDPAVRPSVDHRHEARGRGPAPRFVPPGEAGRSAGGESSPP